MANLQQKLQDSANTVQQLEQQCSSAQQQLQSSKYGYRPSYMSSWLALVYQLPQYHSRVSKLAYKFCKRVQCTLFALECFGAITSPVTKYSQSFRHTKCRGPQGRLQLLVSAPMQLQEGVFWKLQIGTDFGQTCRDTAAARDADVRASVAKLAKLAATSEMQLETLQLQAEGNRIGQLGVSSGGIMGTQPALQHVAVMFVYMNLPGS